eukprot:318467-Chlamydomonas_euryale.AAC.1
MSLGKWYVTAELDTSLLNVVVSCKATCAACMQCHGCVAHGCEDTLLTWLVLANPRLVQRSWVRFLRPSPVQS